MTRSTLVVLALAACLATTACGTDDDVEGETTLPETDTAPTAPSRARRDSAVANSRLPGAGGVRATMEASEAAARRTEASDTMVE